MAKLFPPQDEITLYEDGFADDDLLNRQEVGQNLSKLLERIEDPVVVALDGPWGSGKSHFLRRWVGAHGKAEGNRAVTVYFDAFAHDYLDDPLIGLTAELSRRVPKPNSDGKLGQLRKAAARLGRPVARVGAAMATAGMTEVAGPLLDAAFETAGQEADKAIAAFWKREEGRRAAVEQFRAALTALTAPSAEGAGDGKPLIIVVDELDRCRPDYALAVLEIIKHFFSAPRVHFVLGVNLGALEDMVRARYGAGIDAHDYLKRFIQISMELPEEIGPYGNERVQLTYFKAMAARMELDGDLTKIAENQLELLLKSRVISLRDIERILTRLALLPLAGPVRNILTGWRWLIVSCVLFQVLHHDLFRAAMRARLKLKDVDDFYAITASMVNPESGRAGGYSHHAFLLHSFWCYAISGVLQPAEETDRIARQFDSWGDGEYTIILPKLSRDYFSSFKLLGD